MSKIHFTTWKDALLPAPSSLNELREIWNLLPLKVKFGQISKSICDQQSTIFWNFLSNVRISKHQLHWPKILIYQYHHILHLTMPHNRSSSKLSFTPFLTQHCNNSHSGSLLFQYNWEPECDVSVSKLLGLETFPFSYGFRFGIKEIWYRKSIGFSTVKIWYQKKYRIRCLKKLVSEKVWDSVSFRFWVFWLTFPFRNFSVSKCFHFLDGFGFGIKQIWF